MRLSLFPHQRVAWYWAYLMLADGLVVVRDHEVPLPRAQSRDLEIRADALWSELVCETPMVHWGIGLEAFGVRLDDPADALAGERGERVAVGLDLEWETIAPAFDDGPSRYHHVGRVHGDLLVGADRIAIDGVGARDHGWGDSVWWPEGRHRAAFAIGEGLAGEVTSGPGAVVDGYLWRPGEVPGPLTTALVEISPRERRPAGERALRAQRRSRDRSGDQGGRPGAAHRRGTPPSRVVPLHRRRPHRRRVRRVDTADPPLV